MRHIEYLDLAEPSSCFLTLSFVQIIVKILRLSWIYQHNLQNPWYTRARHYSIQYLPKKATSLFSLHNSITPYETRSNWFLRSEGCNSDKTCNIFSQTTNTGLIEKNNLGVGNTTKSTTVEFFNFCRRSLLRTWVKHAKK